MALPTSRTQDAARVTIHDEICTGCGLCVSVCKDYGLLVENGKARLADSPIFGCVGCGHCMAVCPHGAVEVRGRTLEPEHIFPAPSRSAVDFL
jgi:NAD-dependent dihydropyrimidine dehydrogenase PreA subunit